MSPIVECRGSIPYGLLAGLPVVGVFIVAFFSNTLMGIVVYEGVKLLKSWLLRYPKLRNYYENYVRNALKRFKQYETGYSCILSHLCGNSIAWYRCIHRGSSCRSTRSKKTSGMGFTGCWRANSLHSGYAHNMVCYANCEVKT